MHVCLIRPTLEQGQLVRIQHALEHFEMLAAGFRHRFETALAEHPCKLGPFSWCGGQRNNQSDCHVASLHPNDA
jgi:hypothetical protein